MGMNEVDYANLAALNGGMIHVVYKESKIKGRLRIELKIETSYYRSKDLAMDSIVDTLNAYSSIGDSDLLGLAYGTFDDQGYAIDYMTIYTRRFEE